MMEKNNVFKQNVWNIMYGHDDAVDQSESEEETELAAPSVKLDAKTYSMLPPPPGYIPPSQEEVDQGEIIVSDSSEETEPAPKRKRKQRRQNLQKSTDEKLHHSDKDKELTKNQKRKLKKKKSKEKHKNEVKSVSFAFSAEMDNRDGINVDCAVLPADIEDLQNFFDAIWDIYHFKEKKKYSEKLESFTNLVQSLKVTKDKGQTNVLSNLCKIKRLITLRDFNTARKYIDVFKADQKSLISDDVKNIAATLFEYWITDISDKG